MYVTLSLACHDSFYFFLFCKHAYYVLVITINSVALAFISVYIIDVSTFPFHNLSNSSLHSEVLYCKYLLFISIKDRQMKTKKFEQNHTKKNYYFKFSFMDHDPDNWKIWIRILPKYAKWKGKHVKSNRWHLICSRHLIG